MEQREKPTTAWFSSFEAELKLFELDNLLSTCVRCLPPYTESSLGRQASNIETSNQFYFNTIIFNLLRILL